MEMGEVNELIDYAMDVTKLIDKGGSAEDLLDFTTRFFRVNVYKRFPNFDPKVLEALMLFYTEMVHEMYGDIGGDVRAPIKDLEPNLNQEYNKVARLLGKAFKQTIKKLSGEG